MNRLFSVLCLSATLLVSGFSLPTRAEETTAQEAAFEKYIMEHPEVILRSLKQYNSRDKITDEQAKLLLGDQESPVAGNKNGDVTLVEFFDYHCGYCKRFYGTLSQLLDEDKNVKVVFKELPILSEDSEVAAKASLAVYHIDPSKYFGFHTALMKVQGKYEMDKLVSLAKQAGIGEQEFKDMMKHEKVISELARTKKLAEDLGVSGTPMVIIGKQMIPGAIDLDGLKDKIAKARKGS